MIATRQWLLALGLVGAAFPGYAGAAAPITAAQFTQLQALIKPAPREEAWTRIPWLASLWEARQRAAREGKPILLWEMDGHPLGCT